MAKHKFNYYLHAGEGAREHIESQLDVELSEEVWEKADVRYFMYEVGFECEIDDETGEITVLSTDAIDNDAGGK